MNHSTEMKMYVPTVLHKKILSHTVFLLNKEKAEIGLGSGILIEHKEIPYVITAFHNLKSARKENIFIHLGIDDFKYSLKKEEIFKFPELDLALIRLDKFEVDIFRGIHTTTFKIEKRNIVDIPKQKLKCAISGFPSAMVKLEYNKINAETYFITTNPLVQDEWPQSILDEGKTTEYHILLRYGSKSNSEFVDQNKNVISELIQPEGLSGGAIWVYDPATEDDENPKFGLLGIQTGIYRKYDLLIGSLIDPILKKLFG